MIFSTFYFICTAFSISISIQQLNAQCEEYTSHRNYHLLNLGSACGHGYVPPYESRIAEGKDAGLGVLPWMAQVHVIRDGSDQFMTCGGTLINNRYVLTAAQCFQFDGGKPRAKVELGMYRQSRVRIGECDGGRCAPSVTTLEVAESIVHSSFDFVNFYNDLALLRLSEAVQFTDFIKPVCLPLSCKLRNTDYAGTLMTVAGWGYTSPYIPFQKAPNTLQSAEVPVIAKARCAEEWKDTVKISDSLICAGGTAAMTCHMDSGGPLMTQVQHNDSIQYFQMGVISRGVCAHQDEREKAAVYTRLSYFMLWILDTIKE